MSVDLRRALTREEIEEWLILTTVLSRKPGSLGARATKRLEQLREKIRNAQSQENGGGSGNAT